MDLILSTNVSVKVKTIQENINANYKEPHSATIKSSYMYGLILEMDRAFHFHNCECDVKRENA